MPRRTRARVAQPNAPGEISLPLGIVALVCSALPVIGEFLAVPLGAAALVLGVIGMVRSERGRADNYGQSLAGTTLGLVAVLIVVLVASVTAAAPTPPG